MIFTVNNSSQIVKPPSKSLKPLTKKVNIAINPEILVNGYCHSIQKLLKTFNYNIPSHVIILCIKFYEIHSILNISVGRCGLAFSKLFFESLLDESQILLDSDKHNNSIPIHPTYLRQSIQNKNNLVGRSLFIDLEPLSSSAFGTNGYSSMSQLFSADSFMFGGSNAGYNWAKGFYTEGAEFLDEFMDQIRNEIEHYDQPQGIQLIHGIGGGTGAGLGSLIMQKISDEYPAQIITTFSIFPSAIVSKKIGYAPGNGLVEPYNSVLTLYEMNKHCDCIFVIDNKILYDINCNAYPSRTNYPTYLDLNVVGNQMINDVTSLFRYKDSYGFNLSSFIDTTIKYSKLKYLITTRSPIYVPKPIENDIKSVIDIPSISELNDSLFSSKCSFASCKFEDGIFMQTVLLYRGYDNSVVETKNIKKLQNEILNKTSMKFDNDIIATLTSLSSCNASKSGAMVTNCTSIKDVFISILDRFNKMYYRKAFLHWYKGEGMEEADFEQANQNVADLIEYYTDPHSFIK